MKGIVLAPGVISGEDGKRYEFTQEDVKNLDNFSFENLVKFEVDFIPLEQKASEVYILKQAFLHQLSSDNLESVKTKAYIGLGSNALSAIPAIGWLFSIIGLVFYFLTVKSVSNLSQSKSLMKNYIFILVFSILILIVASILAASIGFAMLVGFSALMSSGAILSLLAFFTLIVATAIFSYKFYKELSILTNENLFMICFYAKIIGLFTMLFAIGILFIIAASIIEIYAWYKIKEIKKAL